MARIGRGYQTFRGNPEQKLFYLINNFTGGINTEFSDDNSDVSDFESIINFDMDKLGTLNKRSGFGELIGISEIFNKLNPDTELPNIKNRTEDDPNPENYNDNIVYMKLLRNDNNCFRALSGFSGENAYRKYQEMYGFQNNKFVLLIITTSLDGGVEYSSRAWLYQCSLPELEYEDDEPTDTETMTITCNKITLPVVFNWDRNLMNLETIEFYDKIYFTGNNKCLVSFDRSIAINSDVDFASAFSYSGYTAEQGDNTVNNAYVPSGLEIRHIGFNVLADDPMHSIDTQGISTDSIQGIFICTTDNIPLQSLPLGQKFLLNIIYTGQDNGFNIEMKQGETSLSFDILANATLSQAGLKVYDVTFKDVPSGEVEIKITKIDATIEPYYDYYDVAKVDAEAKSVSKINIGDHGICEMYNRIVFYKDDTIWFSEVNNFGYVPNYNYITLPIEPTDKITKVCYFKKAYIIFTKQRIYKMTGSFGTSDFAVSPVNMSLGCHAGNTVVPIDDTLFFASPRGLYALRSSQFVEGFENVKELDLKVKKLTSDFTKYDEELSNPAVRFNGISERAYAFRYKDKYLLFYNNYNDKGDYAAINDLDVLTYQFDIGAYTTYRFKEKPTFLFMVDNAIETFATVKQKEVYLDEKPIFNYDFINHVENGIATDLTGNHNDAIVKGNLVVNGGAGLRFNGISSRVTIENGFDENIENGLDIEITTKFSSLNNAPLLALQQSSPIADKISGSMETGKFNFRQAGITNNAYLVLKYTITPNIKTLTDTVAYKIYLYTGTKLALPNQYKLTYTMSPVIETQHIKQGVTSSLHSNHLLDSGTFSIKRTASGRYNVEWEFVANLELKPLTGSKVTGALSATKTISLDPPVGLYREIILKQTAIDRLSLTVDNGDGTSIAINTPHGVGLSEKHNWLFSLRPSGNNINYVIKKDGVEIANSSVTGKLISSAKDKFLIGTDKDDTKHFNGELYNLKISNSSKTLVNYEFNEVGSPNTIYDTISRRQATLRSITWLIDYGIKFKGDGYLELPVLSNIYFSNGFELEFQGTLGGNNDVARLIDLATTYNNDNITNKNSSINVGVNNNLIAFNSTSKTFKTYRLQNTTIDLTIPHNYLIRCVDNGTGYTISLTVDNVVVTETQFEYGGLDNVTRFSNFIGKSNTTTESNFKGLIQSFRLTTYASESLIPVYRTAVYEFDTTSTDFEKPIYVELKTKGINMNYPQHLKKLKHIFVKLIGGYTYNELLFTLYGDGYIVNDPRKYSYYIDEEGQVVQDYEDIKDLKIDERISLLGNMRLDNTKLGEGIYQTRKLIIPKKCKNFALLIRGESEDYISFESFGFVVKLGKVKEG